MRNILTTIGKMIDKQKVAYIASVDEQGFPNMKAMLAPRKREGLSTFYFTTNTSSKRVAQFRLNNKASIYFCDKRFYRGVMLIGTVEVMEDEETKKMIWKRGDTMYYKQGVNDPDYCVLKVSVHKGRYYRSFKSEEFEV